MDIPKTFKFVNKKVIIRLRDRVCETPDELLSSELFREVLTRFVNDLKRKQSMNPNQVNARVVLPVTTYEQVMAGYPIDMVLLREQLRGNRRGAPHC